MSNLWQWMIVQNHVIILVNEFSDLQICTLTSRRCTCLHLGISTGDEYPCILSSPQHAYTIHTCLLRTSHIAAYIPISKVICELDIQVGLKLHNVICNHALYFRKWTVREWLCVPVATVPWPPPADALPTSTKSTHAHMNQPLCRSMCVRGLQPLHSNVGPD